MPLQDGTSKLSEAAGARWRFCRRIVIGPWSNRLYIGGSNQGFLACALQVRISWQAQYLVKFEGDSCCSTQCKWRFICEEFFRGRRSIWWSWRMTPVARRVVNEVSYVTRINHECHFSWQARHFVKFWEIAGARICCIFRYTMRLHDGTSKVSEAAGARWRSST